MPRIFVSHLREDVSRVLPIVEALRKQNLELWWDGDLKAGDPYHEVIEYKLAQAHCIVVCWSASAISPGRDWVRGEAERVRARGGFVISVLLDAIELPAPFNMLHAVQLSNWDGNPGDSAFERLVDGIRQKLTSSRRSSLTPPRSRARRRALLVNVSNYHLDDGLSSLPAAQGNAEALERALKSSACGFEARRLSNPVKQELENALDAFFDGAINEDLLLLYFSGRILQNEKRALFLSATNSTRDTTRSSAIALLRLADEFLIPCPAGQIVFIVDGYYGDGDENDVASALQTALSGRSLVLIASRVGTYPEWQERQTRLTTQIITAIETDLADSNRDGIVTAEEIVHYLNKDAAAGEERHAAALYWSFLASPSQIEIKRRLGRTTEEIALTPDQRSFVTMFASEMERGNIVPFLGDGIYGSGPLSFLRIARALAEEAGLSAEKRHDMVATASESLELHVEDRTDFLQRIRNVFAQQAAQCVPPMLHELIVEMKAPWLVISVNYDDLLQRRLSQAGRPYVVVSHVLRSGGDGSADKDKDAGKILVVRSKNHPEVLRDPAREAQLYSAEDLFLRDDDCVVYLLLGSPFLHDLPFAQERKLDTVAITETDHVDFLVHLREASTGVPAAINARLRMQIVAFLEYNLDFWQYRLIGHLFRRTHDRVRPGALLLRKTPYALRTATSPTEELFWSRRFSPTRIPLDLNTFVRVLRVERSERR